MIIPHNVPDKGLYKTIMRSFNYLKEENYRYNPKTKKIDFLDEVGEVKEVKRGRKKKIS